MNYDLMVIGNGAEAVEQALAAARGGEFVALVRPQENTRPRVSMEVLRQAAGCLIGAGAVCMNDLRREVNQIESTRWNAERAKLENLGVDIIAGRVRFSDASTVEVADGGDVELVRAERIVLACGTRASRPSHLGFDDRRIIDADSLLSLEELPTSLIVVGAGGTGLEMALVLATLGVEVTVVDEQANIFEVCGGLLGDERLFALQTLDVAFRLGDEVIGAEVRGDNRAVVRTASGRTFAAEAVLVSVGREGATDGLNLEAAGVGLDERGRVWCDADGGTWAAHITAVGGLVGFRTTSALAG